MSSVADEMFGARLAARETKWAVRRAVLEARVKWARGEEALEAKAREARAAEEAGRGGAGSAPAGRDARGGTTWHPLFLIYKQLTQKKLMCDTSNIKVTWRIHIFNYIATMRATYFNTPTNYGPCRGGNNQPT